VGLRAGLAGRWTYTHRRVLRMTAVAIAVLVFVFLSTPTWQAALVIAIVLGLIELIGRPATGPQPAGQQ
jgi:L-asparagine transporter-like permease